MAFSFGEFGTVVLRLTIAPTGDPNTFKPVTSSYVRASKDGDIPIVSLFMGSDYSVAYEGTLVNTQEGNFTGNTIGVVDSELQLAVNNNGATPAQNIATFNAYGYLFPGTKIKGHIKISETTHGTSPPPVLENMYKLVDPVSGDELQFILTRNNSTAVFKMIQIRDGAIKELSNTPLAVGVDEIYFEFWYLVNGRSKLYSFSNFGIAGHTKTRLWIGDVSAVLGEVQISARIINAEAVLKTFVSDFFQFKYFKINLRYDNIPTQEFRGQIKVFDDKNEVLEVDWARVRSRDHKFIGNRVIENGLIRIIVKTNNPVIEVYGWNNISAWVKTQDILTDSDAGVVSNKVQVFAIEYMNKEQVKFQVGFGTTSYIIMMTRGNPYINLIDKFNKVFRTRSAKTRFALDIQIGTQPAEYYALVNTYTAGSPVVRAQSSELIGVFTEQGFTKSGFTSSGFVLSGSESGSFFIKDNYFAYYDQIATDVIGWMSFLKPPKNILVQDETGTLKYTHTNVTKGNIFAIGVLNGSPSTLIGGIPTPLVVGAQDTYVKYRGNESLFGFKQSQTIKKKQL